MQESLVKKGRVLIKARSATNAQDCKYSWMASGYIQSATHQSESQRCEVAIAHVLWFQMSRTIFGLTPYFFATSEHSLFTLKLLSRLGADPIDSIKASLQRYISAASCSVKLPRNALDINFVDFLFVMQTTVTRMKTKINVAGPSRCHMRQNLLGDISE